MNWTMLLGTEMKTSLRESVEGESWVIGWGGSVGFSGFLHPESEPERRYR